MCGRYTALTEDEIIEVREILGELSLRIVRDDFEDYEEEIAFAGGTGEVFPTNMAPVITRHDDGVVFESCKWGFKKWNSAGVIINARYETLTTKSTFSKHLRTGRCVVPAGEFFEWGKLGGDPGSSKKIKHYAKDKDGNLLFMAGLYRDMWDDSKSDMVREFVIITKEATGEVAKIHDRMPVLLRVDQIEPWLSGKMTPDELGKLEYDVEVRPCEDGGTDMQISLF
jgi:putative SOS response-associated peptidase YedK